MPEEYKGNSYYEVICYLNPKNKNIKQIFYGMNGKISINVKKVSIANYIKNMFN
ncbi:hypothetical protein WR164_00460 [Philodulcilactobacillus myokoensis]|uniref:Uncharacterized protein n=1 Tax=Philodulcilactobacillus myokoensis TaxID=2929573 RepID=A0A9W6AY14_9LACO|nr:hypothetical protein WR164_00460 [Philodulcilactobacillus myokoensis]